MSESERKHRWYRFRNEYGEVVACVEISQDIEKPFCVGFAFCSPEDRNRSKKIGRDISQGRLMKGKGVYFDTLHEHFKNAKSDRERILIFLKTAELSDLGARPYNGRVEGDHFQQWFTKFREALNFESTKHCN